MRELFEIKARILREIEKEREKKESEIKKSNNLTVCISIYIYFDRGSGKDLYRRPNLVFNFLLSYYSFQILFFFSFARVVVMGRIVRVALI